MAPRPAPEDDFPEGWALHDDSWRFHRQLFARTGRRTAFAEYSGLLAQIRYRVAPKLDQFHFQVTMLDGTEIVVVGGWRRLHGVEYAGWTPRPKGVSGPKPQQAASPPVAAPPPAPAELPPPRRPLRPTTLTLGSPVAARALAERLRQIGIPVSLVTGGPSP
jgi:hypothetical protein